MIKKFSPGFVGIFNLNDRDLLQKYLNGRSDVHFHEDSSGIYLRTSTLNELTSLHSNHGINPLQIRPSNLEDVFLKLTGKDLASDA